MRTDRRLLLFFAFLFATAPQLQAQPRDTTPFRSATWGMTPEEVKAVEEAKPVRGYVELASNLVGHGVDGEMRFAGTLNGYQVRIDYYFSEKKLVAGSYFFIEELDGAGEHREQGERIAQNILDKYGSPLSDETEQRRRYMDWITDDSSITLLIKSPEEEYPSLVLQYWDRLHLSQVNQQSNDNF